MTFEDYKPTQEDIIWARQVINLIADGGILVMPSAMLTYKVSHRLLTLFLLNPEIIIPKENS